jgi:hypothetical protein
MGDVYGRKWIYVCSVLGQVPVYFLAGSFYNVKIVYIAAFFLGPTVIGRMACGFLLLYE